LSGGDGVANEVAGGLGDDTYIVSAPGDSLVEQANEGIDTVRTALAFYSLEGHPNIENLTGLSNSGQVLVGNDADNVILAGSGDDQLVGGLGRDVMVGGAGNDTLSGGDGVANEVAGGLGDDTYIVSAPGDSLVEQANEGIDTVRTALGFFSLEGHPNIENLTGLSNSGQVLVGNDADNVILAGSGDDQLSGGLGHDVLASGAGNDLLAGGDGVANEMAGGTGDDVYIVTAVGDSVVEQANEGIDTVRTTLAFYSLEAHPNIENLTGLSGSGQVLTGNDADNVILAGAGNDQLFGGLGHDVLAGGAGDDLLSGGDGAANEMAGGLGDDTYIVSVAGDSVVEQANEGIDTVQTALAFYSLEGHPNVENLTGLSNSGQVLIGNDADNVILAGSGDDQLFGGLGHDVLTGGAGNDLLAGGDGVANDMIGGQGNDIYVVSVAGDVLVEQANEGTDTVQTALSIYTLHSANVENLTYTGSADFTGSGDAGNNVVTGGAGNDQLDGGLGADTLVGQGGADIFAFTTALGGGNVDTIFDFVSGTDRISLDDAVFDGLAHGALPPSVFHVGAAATDEDQRIIYDQTNGNLYYDADGSGGGAAILFATLHGAPALTAGDFQVI
jgi:serralysin